MSAMGQRRNRIHMTEKSTPHGSPRQETPRPEKPKPAAEGDQPADEYGISSQYKLPPLPAALTDDQPTVISSRNPLHAPQANKGGWSGSLIGTSLGHFEIEAIVGSGGMGTVYRANDTMLSRTVAVKVLIQERRTDDETQRRFQNEAQSAARLDHENIARVYYVGEDQGLHYIVYEFIEGTNIRDLIEKQGAFPLEEAISYTLQMAEALGHACKRDVVHRDIKPSNILVTPSGQAKLVDMGLARLHQVERQGDDLTESGMTLGTFDFISPEQACDPRSADVRSDIYSLGCTLYYMLVGRPPFPDGTMLQKVMRHQADEAPDPRTLRPDVPEEISRITAKMLAKSPEDRYQLPSELIGDLLMFADRAGLKTPATRPTVWIAETQRGPWFERHLPWFMPIAGLFFVVLALDYLHSPATGLSEASNGFLRPPPPMAVKILPRTTSAAPTDLDGAARSALKSNPTPALSDRGNDTSIANPPADKRAIENRPKDSVTTSSNENEVAVAADDARGDKTSTDDLASSSGRNVDSKEGSNLAADKSDGPLVTTGAIVRIVGAAEGTVSTYATIKSALESAVAERAKRGSDDRILIKLRYNGTRRCLPLKIGAYRLTLKAEDGFTPIVEFHADSPDPDKFSRDMIRVDEGRLTFSGIHLVMTLPAQPASGHWSLINAIDARSLQLTDCTMTIHNGISRGINSSSSAMHEDVSFFNITMKARMEPMKMGDDPVPPAMLAITLANCIARGEATLLRTRDVQWVHLQWTNGLLVTTERFLDSSGSTHKPREGSQLQIDLRHLTAITRSGFCSMANPFDAPYQLDTDVNCTHCILMGDSSQPFIHQSGVDTVEEYRELQFGYKGLSNFYENYRHFWWIDGNDFRNEPVVMNFEDWKNRWNRNKQRANEKRAKPMTGTVRWQKLPIAGKPLSHHTAADYALSTDADNPARDAAGPGQDAGARFYLLPKLPQRSSLNDRPREATSSKSTSVESTARPPEPEESRQDSLPTQPK